MVARSRGSSTLRGRANLFKDIGELVMAKLKTVDEIAYVRFASVTANSLIPPSFSKR